MRLLLDTHIVVAILNRALTTRFPDWADVIEAPGTQLAVSVASIWEIAMKTRLGKLVPRLPPQEIEGYLVELGVEVLPVTAAHATVEVSPDVATRDPFDRILVATAIVEGLRFVTADQLLADHPVTFR